MLLPSGNPFKCHEEVLYFQLLIPPNCDQARQSPSRREEGGPTIRPSFDSSDEGLRTRPWPFTPRTEPAISFQGPLAEETSHLCYTFGMANNEEPFKRALMALSSVAVTSEDSVNSNLATLMVDNETSGH